MAVTKVYADVLIGLNLFINYFLFLGVAAFTRYPLKNRRNLLASLVLSFSSLLIFLPEQGVLTGLLTRLGLAAFGIVMAFGFPGTAGFLRLVGAFFAATFAFGGVMLGLWYVTKPHGLVIRNGVVYYDLSPALLITATLLSYGLLWLLKKNFRKTTAQSPYVTLHFQQEGRTVTVTAMVDTGFLLTDLYSGHPTLLLCPTVARRLFTQQELCYRLLPYETVGGSGLLQSALCQQVVAEYNKKTFCLDQVVVAISQTPLQNGYKALVGNDFLERMDRDVSHTSSQNESHLEAVDRKADRLYRRLRHPAPSPVQGNRAGVDGTAEPWR